jgi:hypothetical protein
MNKAFISISLFLVGCGNAIDAITPKINTEIDEELKADFNYFMDSCSSYPDNKKLCDKNKQLLESVKLVDNLRNSKTGTKVVGLCTIDSTGKRTVKILNNAVEQNSYAHKGLMAHELAHCLLDYGHAARSSLRIMAPSLLQEQDYKANWTSLVQDLFTNPVSLYESLALQGDFDPIEDMVWEIHADGSEHLRLE